MNKINTQRYGRDHEIVSRLRPEPMTEAETIAQAVVDETEFEIFRHKMDMIVRESWQTTQKLGASMGMRWGDVAFGVYTASGDLAICATGIYFHAVLSQIPVKYIVKHFVEDPSVGLKEGDAFFFNDPYYGGIHGSDMGLVVPVFHEGKLVCFVGAAVHTGECGGSEPGGMVLGARSHYDEGLRVPPIKIAENFVLREDLMTFLATMTREPRTMVLDIKARLAASRIAERRISAVIAEKGQEFFIGALRRVLVVTGQAARKKISQMNDGIYRQPRFLDTTGPDGGLLKINIEVEKRGDKLKLNLRGSSPMLRDRPMNSFFQGILGVTMIYYCGWFFHDLPANNALLDFLDWEFDDESLVNASGDVAVSYSPPVTTCYVHGMFMLGARMMYAIDPDHAVAGWHSGFNATIVAGINQHGDPVADNLPEVNASGMGGRPFRDGINVGGAFFATMTDCADIEDTESCRPVVYTFRNFFDNSYGHGKYRGGSGVGFGLMVKNVPGAAIGGFGIGSRFPVTLGIFGGRASPPGFAQGVRGSNMAELMAKGDRTLPHNLAEVYAEGNPETGNRTYMGLAQQPVPYAEGDTVYSIVNGGAGYGDILDRDPQAVLKDVKDGLTNRNAARHIYRVAIDEKSMKVDEAETTILRKAAREERLRRAKPYAEFVREWEKQRPPAELLAYYGPYPNPAVRFEGRDS